MFFKRIFFYILRFLRLVILPIIPSGLIRALARLLFSKSWGRFEEACENPRQYQQANLLKIVRRNQSTVFGKEHDFSSINSIEDFQKNVPVSTYDDLEPYIIKMTEGTADVLVRGKIGYFARTSGTTGSAKFIPVNELFLEEFRTARRVWYRQIAQVFPKLVKGTILTMHSPRVEGKTEAGIPFGSITIATGMVNIDKKKYEKKGKGNPEAWEHFQKIPMSIFFIEDINTKYYVLLRFAVINTISMMAAINPSTLILMCNKLTEFGPDLINDCEQGTLKQDLNLDPELRRRYEKRLRKNRKAATRLKASLQKHGRVRPVDIWPKLCGLICWKGGSAQFYLSQFSDWFDDLAVMDYGFAATEGSFSVVMSSEGSQGAVAVTGHFLEFIPEENREDENPSVLTADQLELGKRYYILVTGSHGLYRYDMNDVVEVTGFYRKTPQIVFCHKGGNMISFTGEKIAESHVVQAVSKAQESLGIPLTGFCVTVRLDSEKPKYVFAVETKEKIEKARLLQLLSACEQNLQAANIEYKAKRDTLRLQDPVLAVIKEGAFERWRQEQLDSGAADAHVKTPHLSRDPSILEKLGVSEYIESDTQ
ncbi:MAG: GH3 auxin-responsive promoter family protein [Deltaproteobacteria bacterium]|nr:GH3 auxin-responsive promoter family protein [Deltaproteobacteria bacterium]